MIVKGERNGKQVTYTADMVGRMAPGTGLPASIAALMMEAGDVTVKGVVAPEGCIDPEKFLAALLKRGAKIHQTETIGSLFAHLEPFKNTVPKVCMGSIPVQGPRSPNPLAMLDVGCNAGQYEAALNCSNTIIVIPEGLYRESRFS